MATGLPAGASAPRPRRRRGATAALIGLGAIIVLGVLAVLGDVLARHEAQLRFAEQIRQSLPPGVSGGVDVDIHGFSFLAQLLANRYEHVSLRGVDLTAAGVPLGVEAELFDVTGGDRPVAGRLEGTIRVAPETINSLVTIPGSSGGIELGDGTVSFASRADVFGLPVSARTEGAVSVEGGELVVDVRSIELQAGGISVNPQDVWPELGDARIPICVATLLPPQLALQDVAVAPDGVTASFHADQMPLDEASLAERGTCPAGGASG